MKKLTELSLDAQYLGRSIFWMFNMKGQLRFFNIENRPTARTQAALDELVKEGYLSVEPINQGIGQMYRPLVEFKAPTKKMDREIGKGWVLTEPVK